MTTTARTARDLEDSLARLEHIVAALEHEDLELEQAMALFEEGIGRIRTAHQVLRANELRIDRMVQELADAAEETSGGGSTE